MTATYPAENLDPWFTPRQNWDYVSSNSDGTLNGYEDVTSKFGFVGDGSTNNTPALTAMLNAIDGGDVSTTYAIRGGHYKFSTGVNLAQAGVEFLRLVGLPGGPFYNQTPSTDCVPMTVVFEYTNASASTFLDTDPGSGTLQGAPWFERINFYNSGHANNKALSFDRTNNWRVLGCGFQGWGTSLYSEANNDNAHGKMADCIINVPAGKKGIDVAGGTSNPGAGFTLSGGSISGDTGSIGLYGGPFASAMHVTGGVKFDGCTSGGVVWYGSNCKINGAEFERCSDSTHPSIDFKHDAARGNSGRGNKVIEADVVGHNTNVDLSVRLDTGTFSCYVGSGLYMESVAGGVINNGTYNIVDPQTFSMPSSANYPGQVVTGSNVATLLAELQRAQVVRA